MRQLLSDIRAVELSEEPAGAYCGKALAWNSMFPVRLSYLTRFCPAEDKFGFGEPA